MMTYDDVSNFSLLDLTVLLKGTFYNYKEVRVASYSKVLIKPSPTETSSSHSFILTVESKGQKSPSEVAKIILWF